MNMPIKNFLLAAIFLTLISPGHAEEQIIKMPEFQQQFCTILMDYSAKYTAETNELKKSKIRTDRKNALMTLKYKPSEIKDWIGVLKSVGTTSEGTAFVEISIPSTTITAKTWNNSLSDFEAHTLIKQSNPLYDKLAEMNEGDAVTFSGKFLGYDGITEEGKMVDPGIIIKFSDIKRLGTAIQ